MHALELRIDEPYLRLIGVGPVTIGLWLRVPTSSDIRDMRDAIRPYVAQFDAFVALNIVDISRAAPMGEDVRREVAETQREFDGRQRALANVIEGDGFYAASVRSIASGMAILSRVKFEQRIFGTVEPAAMWLASTLPPTKVDTVRVIDAAARLRFIP
jgi:hypothetical protein